jgi:protein involved in sex pheromone biosynthesis
MFTMDILIQYFKAAQVVGFIYYLHMEAALKIHKANSFQQYRQSNNIGKAQVRSRNSSETKESLLAIY